MGLGPVVAVIGASGSIGAAFVQQLLDMGCEVYAFSRREIEGDNEVLHKGQLDLLDEGSISAATNLVKSCASGSKHLDAVIVCTGLLHDDAVQPEKSLRDLSMDKFQQLFEVNTIGPALVAKHFLPLLHRDRRVIFAALSARVGSIADNRLGGWYAYRASKAALNMIIKNISIEYARRNPTGIVVGLHPGTVDSALSKPFQARVAEGKLFTPAYSVSHLVKVLEGLTQEDTGECFAWDGQRIEP